MAEFAEITMLRRASGDDGRATSPHPAAALPQRNRLAPLTEIPADHWRALAEHAIEPNGYYLPAWELAVNASAHGRTAVSALGAWNESRHERPSRLIGLLPVVSLWRAFRIPLPALVSASPYGTLCTPLIARNSVLANH